MRGSVALNDYKAMEQEKYVDIVKRLEAMRVTQEYQIKLLEELRHGGLHNQ